MRKVLNLYPLPIHQLWYKALNYLPYKDDNVETILSFGSFTTGDFSYVIFKGNLYALSDFDYSIITKPKISLANKSSIVKKVDEYNNKYSRSHFGFNMNVRFWNRKRLTEYLAKNSFLNNSLIHSGITVRGNRGFLRDLILNGERDVSVKELFKVYCQIVNSLLIHLDERMIDDQLLYPLYLSTLFQKNITKLSFIYSVIQGTFPKNINDALDNISGRVDSNLLKIFQKAKSYQSNHLRKSLELDREIARSLNHVLIELYEWFQRSDSQDAKKEKMRSHFMLLSSYLGQLSEREVFSNNKFEKDREKIAYSILLQKDEHYDFKKRKYGIYKKTI